MSDATVGEVVSKRLEMYGSLGKLLEKVAADLKELKYQVNQYDAKVKTYEGKILAAKAEILELDEAIRQRKIEVTGSFNGIRDEHTAREEGFVKREQELSVREMNLKVRSAKIEEMMVKAEKAVGKQSKKETVSA